MASRSKEREVAFQALYAYESHKRNISLDELLRFPWIPEKYSSESNFAQQLVYKTITNLSEIENIYNEFITINNSDNIILVVDKILIQMGVGEMMFLETDYKIVINEIITLTKRYSIDNSYKLINGILNSVANKLYQLQE